jgi:hypothetical protein
VEELLDRLDADRREHLFAVAVRQGELAHRPGITARRRTACRPRCRAAARPRPDR